MDGRKNSADSVRDAEGFLDRAIKEGKKVLLVEYVDDSTSIDWVYERAKEKRYVAYATSRALDTLRINKGHGPD